ncbi:MULTISPECIES: AsmA family protein [Providencia]|uniref:AsmA family protein n=1 Tax=Providencia huaxiensis TaxID=2027290 RepID=A0ABU2ISI2_9GAMM|nr:MULTISPECIES: AsmA family protein [Providencia]MBZ3680989.1 AsmA family protein [Providencia rettgeri]AXH63173.1 AsmA family protein [Providencia huaxiensis]MDT0132027.1 AsmA family protein [Providencia huaxiensis]MDT1978433.1 AsmA family protein [Providencia huaxiensis]QLR01564.1 AsmA family protein [Providencia rettgeri]
MKWLIKFTTYALLLLLLLFIFTYIGLQTRWGASYSSQFLSKFTNYDIDVGIMGHEFSNPGEFIFQDVKLAAKNSDLSLDSRQVVLDVNWKNIFSGTAIKRLVITQGTLSTTVTPDTILLPISANILQFENSQITLKKGDDTVQVTGFTGGITPWKPTENTPFGYGDFRFTSNQLKFNDLSFKNVAITGKLQQQGTEISQASAYLNNGYIAGAGKVLDDGSIMVDSLTMNKVGWENKVDFDSLFDAIASEKSLQVKKVELTNVDIQGKDWALSGLSTEIDQLSFTRGSWTSSESNISFNVDQFVVKDQQLSTLIGDLKINGDNLSINKLSGYYNKGVFNLSGSWQRNDRVLTIDEGKLAGILYTLPETWLSFFAEPTPAWLSGLSIKKFTLSQSLLMNIQPQFPFELTALSGNIENIDLIKQKQWGIWSGKATFTADSGTINQVLVRRPFIEVRQSGKSSAAASLTVSTDKGISKIGLLVKQEPKKVPFLLRASGSNIDLVDLNQWGWAGFPAQVIGDFDATLQGDLLAPSVAKSLNGELMAVPLQGKRLFRTVVNGVVTSSVESDADLQPIEPSLVEPLPALSNQ